MAIPSVTHTFVNSTTADATQVNTNFTDIINSLTDGSKDLSISALTLAGNFTANGTTNTLGSASNDDLVINASLASTIPIKTTFTYDIGATAIGLRDLFFGDAGSAARSTKIRANTIAASTTLTLPTRTGTVEVVPTITASQTGTYAVLATDDFIQLNVSGGAFTSTLPTAVGAAGKIYRFKRLDQTLGTAATIATTSSQTIDGVTTTTLDTQYEMLEVISDGANWQILRRHIPSVWTSYTPTGAWSSNTTYTGFWRRVNDSIEIRVKIATSGAPTAASCTASLPTNLTIDTAKIPTSGTDDPLGHVIVNDSGTTLYLGSVMYNNTTTVRLQYHDVTAAPGVVRNTAINATAPMTFGAGDYVNASTKLIPITGWKG